MRRAPALLLLALATSGCPNPQLYAPPRTLPKGESSHAVAFETYEWAERGENFRVPSAPTYLYRHGVSDEVDFGLRAGNLSSFGADLKYNFLRSDLDLAIDPSFQFSFFPVREGSGNADDLFYVLTLPLLIGLNAAPEFTVVLGGGVNLVEGVGFDADQPVSEELLYAHGTIGFDLRMSRRLAVHPSVSLMRGLGTGDVTMIITGCAVRFGGPAYEGLSE